MAKQSISLRWLFRRKGRPSGLQEGLIISLTSYPPRFASLALTLRCLLSQTVSADRTILWVTAEDYRLLPASVIDLRDEGLEIRFCKNIRSYKKIIPALLAFPNSYIVTADDDVYYSSRWLEELVELAGKGTIVCHRAHSVQFDEGGQIEPYDKWGYEAAGKGSLLFPTGVGGVLYGPGSLSPDVLDDEAFMQLCPQADDVWLFWMGRRAGSDYVKTRKHWSEVSWNGTQGSALHLTNVAGKGNDEQIKSMVNRYGLPSRSGELKRRPFNADEMIARIPADARHAGHFDRGRMSFDMGGWPGKHRANPTCRVFSRHYRNGRGAAGSQSRCGCSSRPLLRRIGAEVTQCPASLQVSCYAQPRISPLPSEAGHCRRKARAIHGPVRQGR